MRRLLGDFRQPLGASSPRWREAILAGLMLAAIAVVVYAPHVAGGGWYSDDWVLIARMNDANGLSGVLGALHDEIYRPGYVVWLGLFYLLVGDGQSPYLAIGVAIAAAESWLLYLVLRQLGVRLAVAAVAAALFVVLPCIDATRLWLTIFQIPIAGSLYLLGLLLALRGLRGGSPARAAAWHGAAVALYLWAMLTYEASIGLVAATVLLYAAVAGWRAAARRAAADYAAIGLALALVAQRASDVRGAETSLSFIWDRTLQMLVSAEQVFRGFPAWSEVLGGPVGLAALIIGVTGAGVAIGRGGPSGAGFAAWSRIAAIAAVFAVAGLVMYLPADVYFVPRQTGLGNRTGALAALGAVVLFVALVVLAIGGLGEWVRRPAAGVALAIAVLLASGASMTVRELRQQQPWTDAWEQQQGIVAAVGDAMGGRFPPGSAYVSFRHTTIVLPDDVSVFSNDWDLRGALWQTFGQRRLAAHAWVAGARCDDGGVWFPYLGEETPAGSGPFAYQPRLYFVDVAGRSARAVTDRRSCEREVATLTGA